MHNEITPYFTANPSSLQEKIGICECVGAVCVCFDGRSNKAAGKASLHQQKGTNTVQESMKTPSTYLFM